MIKEPRLRFTREEQTDPALEKPIRRAQKAAVRADKAQARIPKKKVRQTVIDPDTGKKTTKLTFEEQAKPPSKLSHAVRGAPANALLAGAHKEIRKSEQDNVGVEGAHKTEQAVEVSARLVREGYRSHKLKPYREAARAEQKLEKANINALYQKSLAENPQLASNPLSRWQQKQAIKKEYAAAKRAGQTAGHTAQAAGHTAKTAHKTGKAAKSVKEKAEQAGRFVMRHKKGFLIALALFLLVCLLMNTLSSCSMLAQSIGSAVSGSTYPSKDEDMLGAEADYAAKEAQLQTELDNMESLHPGYDEYRYNLDPIGHNPHELAAYLSALLHEYTPQSAAAQLQRVFDLQYVLTLTEEVEIRYRTETSTDPETGETTTEEVPYEYYILNVTLTNKTLPAVILPRLNEQQREIYTVMQQLKGNKPYLWEGIYNGGEDTGPSYEIPGEALDDPAFAALMEEATKYIGWPYVWGGSSPSTSFDCSGFVCWVYTASGVHNLPRTTAQGIYNQCAIISPSEAKPGDIIFFTGTYDSPGPVSHVGIYVGDGMMLHCGSPIQYANINSSYWQTHFYAFGRL